MKIKSIGLAAALALTLAACSDSSDTEETTTESGPVAVETTDDSDSADDNGGTEDATDSTDGATEPEGTETSDDAGSDSAEAPGRDIDLASYDFAFTLEEAIEASNAHTGGGTIHQVGMDWDEDTDAWVWEVDTISDGRSWELEINATTGDISEQDEDDEDDDEPAVDPFGSVDYHAAMSIAIGEVPGTVSQWDLDWNDDREIYSIEVRADGGGETEIEIDASNGDIVEIDD
ncbi:PepSY domain-containing protein [Flaviflexus massiliensis]|uniref:PepSY domain-containing protein n=1 Tax=Flaviflexus massiliensis TaxID=1522309 RepID=UPI0006D576F1|nr:PepSY domain-containing protein [Flaviflexus massiliensis]